MSINVVLAIISDLMYHLVEKIVSSQILWDLTSWLVTVFP